MFRQGESFRLFTNSLKDNDDTFCPPGGLEDDIGSFSQDFNFQVGFQSSFSREIGSGGCRVRANYVFTKLD